MTTRASDSRPVRRVVKVTDRWAPELEYTLEVEARVLRLRPLRSRRGGPAEVVVPYSAIYLRAMAARVEEQRRAKRKGAKR